VSCKASPPPSDSSAATVNAPVDAAIEAGRTEATTAKTTTAEPWFPAGLFVAGEHDVYLYGTDGGIERSVDGGKTFEVQTSGSDEEIVGMVRSRAALWAVHLDGVRIRRDAGGSWSDADPSHDAAGASVIWGDATSGTVYLAGAGFVARTFDEGAHWTRSTFPALESVDAIWGASSSDIYVIGARHGRRGNEDSVDYEMYESHDATAAIPHWREAKLGPHGQLFALGGTSTQDVYVTGSIGARNDEGPALFHTSDGKTWTHSIVGTQMLVSIWTSAPHDVFLGTAWRGMGGSIVHTVDGHKWTTVKDGIPDVEAIRGAAAGAVYVLSSRGLLLRNPRTATTPESSAKRAQGRNSLSLETSWGFRTPTWSYRSARQFGQMLVPFGT
jgi:hypothetical protein